MLNVRRRFFRLGSPAESVIYRGLMAASTPRVMGVGSGNATPEDRAVRALARALRTTALGRLPAEERAWVARIEARRQELASDRGLVPPHITGRRSAAPDETRHGSIPVAASGWLSLPRVWCIFLMRLVRELSPRSCLELGTGFGISGAYEAASLELGGAGVLTTLEGAVGFAEIAKQGFSALGLSQRLEVLVGPIDDTLDEALERARPVDFAFLDADHSEQATLEYFNAILPRLSQGAVVVLDDINWEAAGMPRAWWTIRNHDLVSFALGFRRIGVCVISGPRR
jgi:predicted O-methyltransferase YrrM